MRKQIISIVFGVLVIFGGGTSAVMAMEEGNMSGEMNITELRARLSQLLERVDALKDQILERTEERIKVRTERRVEKCESSISPRAEDRDCERIGLRIEKRLERGMRGTDVRKLQKILATDPAIYPEGLVTGYFGKLTQRAVERFQERNDLPRLGKLGPETRAKMNAILKENRITKGEIPSDLLRSLDRSLSNEKESFVKTSVANTLRLRTIIQEKGKDVNARLRTNVKDRLETDRDLERDRREYERRPALRCTNELLRGYKAFFEKYGKNGREQNPFGACVKMNERGEVGRYNDDEGEGNEINDEGEDANSREESYSEEGNDDEGEDNDKNERL